MNTWFTKNLGDAMLAGESLAAIKALFLGEYEKAGQPKEMAVFIRHESEGRLHCEVRIYFSPSSVMAATAVNAIPCAKPVPGELDLLAGSRDAWPIFFTECTG
ncbi:hypothetical protein CAP31_07695 [Sulfuriferula sp. AH1]|uniref:hypothetical protein n=1 Tax=Sulfuriferula sp. AH1 TaxID=1985873 RepID=UPI000B3B6E3C|nr:hypothetical protein [Sulfuriferula sp. AH1]ARU31579.1 hypothetical protein CAP31_07695 [Sulfuriferula sp. AH1]